MLKLIEGLELESLLKKEKKRIGIKLIYRCNKCQGLHYFYGSAEPKEIDFCRICHNHPELVADERYRYQSKRHIIKTALIVRRNNNKPHKIKKNQ